MQLEDVSAWRRLAARRGAAASKQGATVLEPLRPHPPPRLPRLRCRLSSEGEFGALRKDIFQLFHLDLLRPDVILTV